MLLLIFIFYSYAWIAQEARLQSKPHSCAIMRGTADVAELPRLQITETNSRGNWKNWCKRCTLPGIIRVE